MSIQVKRFSKAIVGRPVIRNVSFEWSPGKIIGLVGRNGVGKTTLFRTMTNQYRADAGEMVIDGQDVRTRPYARQRLFYVDTQRNFFGHQTLQRLIGTYALAYADFNRARMRTLLNAEHLPVTARYAGLSKGQQMLFQTLLALACGTPYVILDEPFDGLDVLVRERIVARIVAAVTERRVSFLISSHNLDELDGLCDQVLLMKDHQIVANYDLEMVRQRARKFQLVFADKRVPAVVKRAGTIVKVYGRVLEVYFAAYTPTVARELKAARPVMMTACPLTITDLFRVQLGAQRDVMVGD